MVGGRMRDPEADGFPAGGGELVDDEAGFFTRVDHHTCPARLVDDEIAVLGEQPVRDRDDSHDATSAFSFSRVAARYFSTAIAAVVASPTAVVIWRGSWLRTSPAAHSPGVQVIIRSSVTKEPPASCLTWPSTLPALGLDPMNTNAPVPGSCAAAPVPV